MAGPLQGLRILELAGIGPAPFAAMMLADHGAEVIRVNRLGAEHTPHDPMLRSRRSITLDLKSEGGVTAIKELCRTCDGLIEGFRPGVMERLGLGPDLLLTENPNLIYGCMTGWGQHGPNASLAGHDINYLSISGTLSAIGREGEQPLAPLNLVGDFGGGGMMMAFAMVAALLAVRNGSGGQVIDCAMIDGSALLMASIWGARAEGSWVEERGVNALDSGAPFYETYKTADGEFIAVGSLEPQFYQRLLEKLCLQEDPLFADQWDRSRWPQQKAKLESTIRSRTRADWTQLLADCDTCASPVLSMTEALEHPHNVARKMFIDVGGVIQPAPAPRYSVTPCDAPRAPTHPSSDNDLLLGAPSIG